MKRRDHITDQRGLETGEGLWPPAQADISEVAAYW